MSADKHRARDRRRTWIWKLSHNWDGVPVQKTFASQALLQDKDVKRLIRDGDVVHTRSNRGVRRYNYLHVS